MGYPSNYKKGIVYVDAKDYEKIPHPYKSYSSDKLGGLPIVNKKMSPYNGQNINDVVKEIELHKVNYKGNLLNDSWYHIYLPCYVNTEYSH